MAGSIKGIIVEIGGDTSGLQKALSKVNSASSSLSKELRGINSLLKLDPKNTELLTQKQTVLNQQISTTEDKLKQLEQIKNEADKKMSEGTQINEENYRSLQREIINTQNKLSNFKNEASKWNKTGTFLTNLGTELTSIGTQIDNLGSKLTTRVSLPIVAGFGLMTKSAIENETAMQQVGRIYGDASDSIKDFAENQAINYNMSSGDAYKYSQIYGNLIQSITDDQNENADNTQKLLKASSIIASATGRTMEDVMDRVRSGLLGNTEAIEDLGVNVNVSLLESTDAFKKFAGDKSWNQLDFQTQQQIRLMGILEQTSKKYGDEVNNNTASSIQQLTAKTKNLSANLGNKLLPIATKLIDKANKLVDKFGDLSDSEQENIIKIGLMVAVAGPALKIAGTAITTVGKVSKGIGTLTTAVGLAKNGIGDATGASANLAKMLKGMANPTGIAVTAIAGISLALTYLITKENEAQKAHREFAEQMSSSKKSLDEYNLAIDETANANLAQINSVERLKNELKTLVDENGKVKEGYETRVSFILNELNKALGTEYTLNDNIINKYKEFQGEIDNLILKKKAEIKLSADEEKYKNAINNQETAVNDLKTAYENLQGTQDEYGMTLNELRKKASDFYELSDNWLTGKGVAGKLYKKQADDIQNVINAYDDAENRVKTYTSEVENYQLNYELFLKGSYENIASTAVNTTQNWTDASLETIKKSIEETSKNLDTYKAIYESTGNEVAFTQKEQSEASLKSLSEELLSRVSTVGEAGEKEIEAWKTLATSSYSTYYDTISPLDDDLKKKIEEMTGVTAEKTPELTEETKKMMTSVLDEVEKNADFKKEALSNLTSFLNGLEDDELRELLKEAGVDNSEEVIKGIRKGNLAEDEGTQILSSLQTGLDNKTWKDSLWNTARGIASTLSGLLTVKANVNGTTSKLPGHKKGLDYVPYDDYIARLHKGERVLTAEENKQLMQMEKTSQLRIPNMKAMSKAVSDSIKTVFTTPTIIINAQDELTPNKINTIIDTVNRRFGSQI